MYITFDVDGSIKGHGGCNAFSGTLQASESGIEVGPLGSTRMACGELVMSRETRFLEAVQNTRGFQEGRDSSKLLDGDGNTLAELVENTGSQ
jgi:heat shock protein HslJ